MHISTEPDLLDHVTQGAQVPSSTSHIRRVEPMINMAHTLTSHGSNNQLGLKLAARLAKGQD